MLDISALRAKLYCLIYLLTFQIQCSQNCALVNKKQFAAVPVLLKAI